MREREEVTFRMEVDHFAVRRALQELENRTETSVVREGLLTVYTALLCSDVVYVPESKLAVYLPFCKRRA